MTTEIFAMKAFNGLSLFTILVLMAAQYTHAQ